MRIKLFLIFAVLSIKGIYAQDPVFTQFYAVPIMTNPAFAGSENNTRFSLGYRDQWMGSGYSLSTFFASADKFVDLINSGVGVSVLNQNESLTYYNYIHINISYSYHLQLTDNWTFFPGISFGYGFKQLNQNSLILGDQIDINNGTISPGSNDPSIGFNNVNFFDISVGGIIYSENAWLGVSLKHLTHPVISFAGQDEILLDMFFSVHGGYQWDLFSNGFFPEDSFLYFTADYMKQGEFNRIEAGTELKVSRFSIGSLVSGTVQKITEMTQMVISVNPVIGLEFEKFKLGISYDYPISKYSYLNGTGEVTFQYFIKNSYRRKRVWQKKH